MNLLVNVYLCVTIQQYKHFIITVAHFVVSPYIFTFQTIKERDDDDESHTSGGASYITVSANTFE